MKKKEFKEYLKNEIIEILSEEESAEDIKAKAAAQAELNKELEKTQSLTKESLNPEVTKAVDRFIKSMAKRYDYSEQDAVFAIQAALKQRKFDKPADIPGFEGTMDALDSLSIREEEEPTSADVKKEKSIAKEKEDALKIKAEIDKIKKDLKKNKPEMLKISKIDRKDRTKAEQSLFDKMVDKTKELKKLERNL
jgi:multidrug efflux pump subunit AcrA (membrane-fusion protein)